MPDNSGCARRARAGSVLALAAWFGIASGLSEAVVLLGLQGTGLAAYQWIRDGVGPPMLWISPAFDLVLFSLIGLLWAGAAAAFPRRDLRPWAAGFFSWMGFFALLAAMGRLTDIACAMLGLGLAVRVGVWFARAPQARFGFLERSLPRLALLAAGVGGLELAGEWIENHVLEPRYYAQLPAPPAQAPNVLLIVMDTVRADHLSGYGYARRTTPNFDRLARECVLFRQAYSTASWTLPSHASLVTGLLPHEHEADVLPLRPEFLTLAEFLDSRGYATAGFVSNTIWCTRASGFAQGIVHHEDYFDNWADRISRTVYSQKLMTRLLELFGVYRDVARKSAADVNRDLLEWLDRRPDRPFFIFVNYFDAHEPTFPPAPYDGMFASPGKVSGRVPFDFAASPPGSVSAEAQQAQIDAYDGALAYMDAQLGALWAALERRGLANNTLLIVTADHGESLGEAGLYGHRSSLRLEQIRVPLLLRLPDQIPAGTSVAQPVSLKRIPATVTSLAGFADRAAFPGTSLESAFLPGGGSVETEPVVAELTGIPDAGMPAFWPVTAGNLRSIVTERWQYVERTDGKTELYDLLHDAKEESNLAASSRGSALAGMFHFQLALRAGMGTAASNDFFPPPEAKKPLRVKSAPLEDEATSPGGGTHGSGDH